jgi:hypothetical protein
MCFEEAETVQQEEILMRYNLAPETGVRRKIHY